MDIIIFFITIIILITQIVSAIALIDHSRFRAVRRLMGLYLVSMLLYVFALVLGLPIFLWSYEVLMYGLLIGVPIILFLLHLYALCLSAHLKKKSAAKEEIPEPLPSDAAQ